jgi:hypothetical protein
MVRSLPKQVHKTAIKTHVAKPATHVPPSGGTEDKSKVSELDKFLWAEGEKESHNDYNSVNPNSGALGRWQVMPANLPSWLSESGQPQMTPNQFLANHKAQDAVAETILGGYYKQYGAAGAAAMWYSGQPDPTKKYGDPPVYEYVNDVLSLMGIAPDKAITDTGTTSVQTYGLPVPDKTDSWGTQIHNSAEVLHGAGLTAEAAGKAIASMY